MGCQGHQNNCCVHILSWEHPGILQEALQRGVGCLSFPPEPVVSATWTQISWRERLMDTSVLKEYCRCKVKWNHLEGNLYTKMFDLFTGRGETVDFQFHSACRTPGMWKTHMLRRVWKCLCSKRFAHTSGVDKVTADTACATWADLLLFHWSIRFMCGWMHLLSLWGCL